MTLFERCIPVILKSEGGYQNDPDDIGNWTGANKTGLLKGTKYGIAARFFPDVDIVNLTLKEAEKIYYDRYWLPMNMEGILDHELVLHIFDHGINAGRKTAIKMIQKIVEVKQDGIVGPITEKAVNEFKVYTKVIEGYGLLQTMVDHYKYERHCYYIEIARKRTVAEKYLKGWLNRIDNCHF